MARVTFNKPGITFRAFLGDLIPRQNKNDTFLVSKATHPSEQKSNTAHSSQRQNSQSASADRNRTIPLHPVYEELAQATHKTAYNIALSDRMMPPVIHRMMLRGGSILTQASDNVMVVRVEVQVLGEQGEVLEQGDAVRLKGDWWEYIPSYAGVRITAAAWDLAGNVTMAEL